jgi:hypothetical protein
MRLLLRLLFLGLILVPTCAAQAQDSKPQADTLAIQADAVHEADPDLATLRFQVSFTDKELRKAYDRASASLQRILQLAERNSVARNDVSTGPLTVFPDYDWGDRKRRIRAYRVESDVALKLRDFSKVGPLIDEAVQDGITEFRSLSYSLADEEAAKQRAVGEAMRRAEGRARAALGQNGSRLGPLRYANIDVKQVVDVTRVDSIQEWRMRRGIPAGYLALAEEAAPAPLPPALPAKIRVSASVQCVFQLQ